MRDVATHSVSTIAVAQIRPARAVSPVGRRVYVTSFATSDMSVIDAPRTRPQNGARWSAPLDVALSSDGRTIFVAYYDAKSVSIISGARHTTVDVGSGPARRR